MLDDDLRTQLAEWVSPLAELPAPQIRVLRRRIRRRRTRWGAGSMAVVAAAAAVAVAVIGILPGPGRPSVAAVGKTPAAPGTWYPGRWFAAGKPPAADAGPAAAPYVVTIAGGREAVTDAFTGASATAGPPSGGSFAGVAAAGDDRTFLLAARIGASVGFYEQRLGPTGRPGPPVLVFRLPASSVPAFAISPDASQLAYSMPGGIRVVSLATGAGRSWTAGGGEVVGLSWAGGKTVALTWATFSAGQISSVTVRLLATSVPGTRLMSSRQLVPVCANPSGLLCIEENAISTADGSKVFVVEQFNQSGAVVVAVQEFSGNTRRTVYSASFLSGAAALNTTCVAPWTDPSGAQLVVYCGHWVTIDNGRLRPVGLHVPVSSLNGGGQLMAW
jgi:hypothetical protein